MKLVIGLFLLLLAIVGVFALYQNYSKGQPLPFFKTPSVTIKGHTFTLMVAKTAKERENGLSTKSSLDKNAGMLFVFDGPGYYPFWMKNVKFPIDILYVNKDSIVTIHQNAQPVTGNESPQIYKSIEQADKVLEINAGLSESYGFKENDSVKFQNL